MSLQINGKLKKNDLEKKNSQTTINISVEHHTNNYPIIFDLFYK